jgi:hypothetical protein
MGCRAGRPQDVHTLQPGVGVSVSLAMLRLPLGTLAILSLLTVACDSGGSGNDTDVGSEATGDPTDANPSGGSNPSGGEPTSGSDTDSGTAGSSDTQDPTGNPTSGPTSGGDTETGGPSCAAHCEGSESVLCDDDGGEVRFDCGGINLACDEATGQCEGPCAPHDLDPFTGCGFTALTTRHDGGSTAVLSITADAVAAEVTVDALQQTTLNLEPGETAFVEVADNDAVSSEGSVLAPGAAYQVQSTAPVRVVQFVPISNSGMDSSTLLAHHAWGQDHHVVSYPDWGYAPGMMAVVARHDGTTVTFEGSSAIGVADGTAVDGNGNGSVTMDRGDVLQLVSATDADLTGLHVSADAPIQVIGGHGCTAVEYSYCDHLEEVMPPHERLGTHYVVALTPNAEGMQGEMILRLVATEAGTTVSISDGTPGEVTLDEAGSFADVVVDSVVATVEASAPVIVGEMMLSPRKPSLAVAWPEDAWRDGDLAFGAPNTPSNDYVQAICPEGTAWSLDGSAVQPFDSAAGYSVYLQQLDPGGHMVSSDQACTTAQVGYRSYASYFNRLR